ncbi:MAG: hypothetical protein K2Z81_21650, partial [Cyanobacteria bacterium]|nr:hypothetical protein [Cyanobacteriota bacterium]
MSQQNRLLQVVIRSSYAAAVYVYRVVPIHRQVSFMAELNRTENLEQTEDLANREDASLSADFEPTDKTPGRTEKQERTDRTMKDLGFASAGEILNLGQFDDKPAIAGEGIKDIPEPPPDDISSPDEDPGATRRQQEKEAGIQKLIDKGLGSDEFAEREAAQKALEEKGIDALPQLMRSSRDSADPEVRRRSQDAVETIVGALRTSNQTGKLIASNNPDVAKLIGEELKKDNLDAVPVLSEEIRNGTPVSAARSREILKDIAKDPQLPARLMEARVDLSERNSQFGRTFLDMNTDTLIAEAKKLTNDVNNHKLVKSLPALEAITNKDSDLADNLILPVMERNQSQALTVERLFVRAGRTADKDEAQKLNRAAIEIAKENLKANPDLARSSRFAIALDSPAARADKELNAILEAAKKRATSGSP